MFEIGIEKRGKNRKDGEIDERGNRTMCIKNVD